MKILIDSEPPNGQIWWGLTPAKEHSEWVNSLMSEGKEERRMAIGGH